ncbi:MAG: ABC transporter permease [Alphaproteobacteria bacterium]|nr:ABC transporter permease [Alphaproteobacteria bacterium]
MTIADVRQEPRGVRGWYSNFVSAGWVVPVFTVVWIGLVVVPLLIMVLFSFVEIRDYRVVYDLTLKNWESLIDSGRWISVVRTLRVTAVITLIEILVAFPFALWLAKGCKSKNVKAAIITLLTIPFFLDPSSRTIVWRAILGKSGIINTVFIELGLIDQPMEWLLFSEFAVHFGMIAPYFPTMVFPIYLVLTLIDDDYLQASQDLGASPLQTLIHIILPLALPGIVAGIVFTMVPLMAAFVEPGMLGGGFVNLLGESVEAALRNLKYPTAAALSAVVIALLAVLLTALVLILRRRGSLGAIFVTLKR